MERSYFLGANTASGFVSLYSGFCRGEGDYLHIVKGGPGTGKSGFMRALGREAARRGYDIELLRCSGDPASLDGLYIPALRIGWVDGTAPHVSEPGVFGADCDYKNLGCFCRTPLSPADAARAAALNEAYKERYARAYSLLAAGEKLEAALTPSLPDGKAPERAEAVLRALRSGNALKALRRRRLLRGHPARSVKLRLLPARLRLRGWLRLRRRSARCGAGRGAFTRSARDRVPLSL